MTQKPARAVFLDRDDTLVFDEHYMSSPDQIRLLPGVREGLERLHQAGFLLVVISNQSGVARGLITKSAVYAIQERICQILKEIPFADFEYCFHHPDDHCECRKPKPALILKTARRLGIRLELSVMVGDKVKDIEAGNAAGCYSIQIPRDATLPLAIGADLITGDFNSAVDWILQISHPKVS